MRQIVFLIIASVISVIAFAQEHYNLKEAISYSLDHHGSNLIYNNQIAKVQLQSKEALSAYLPQVNGNITFDDNLKLPTTMLPGAMFNAPKDIPVQFGQKFNAGAVIQLDQTIFDQVLLYGIKAGVPAQKIAVLNQVKNKEEIIYNTATAYTQILVLKEQQKLLMANEKQYQCLYDFTKFRFDEGVVKRGDLDRITVQLSNVKVQLQHVKASIDVAYNALKNAMGLSLDAALQIADSLDYTKYLLADQDTVHVLELIDYQLQRENIMLQQIDVKRKQAAYLPSVSAYARYGGQGFGNELGNVTTDWNRYSAVGLKINVPIFSGRRKESQLRQSRLELDNQKQNLELSIGQLQMQFQNAARQLQEQIATLNINKSNMDLAKRVYETSQFEYSKGVTTIYDLLNADFSYQQTQANYMTSLLNVVANRLQYERAKGTITNFINQL